MARLIDYPRAPLDRAFALAEAVDKLGGEASTEIAAESMGNKIGGAFNALVGAAVKYGLISNSKGRLKTEPLFQDYKLAYTEVQKKEAIRRAFLNAPLFSEVVNRLQGQTIPPHFEKLLIKEHGVSEETAPRLVSYFNEGARDAGLLDSNGVITVNPTSGPLPAPTSPQAQRTGSMSAVEGSNDDNAQEPSMGFVSGYTVRITGPGIDTKIAIKEEEDIEIVDVTLRKVRRLLKAQQQETGGSAN